MHRLALCLVFVTSTLAAPRPAAAAVSALYDTIDSAEVSQRANSTTSPSLTVQGILAGTSTPVTRTYFFNNNSGLGADGVETALHCQRLALMVMSKPGKFQFGIGRTDLPGFARGCRITRAAP